MGKVIESGADLPHPPPLTEDQRRLITATVPVLAENGVKITSLMYSRMLSEHPELRNIFSQSKQARGHQPQALARSIYAYAAHIDDLTPILPVVERIAHKHASVHILPSMYSIVAKYLMEAITEVVGPDTFKDDLYNAWGVAYWNLAHTFIDRERELYEAAAWTGWREFVVERKVAESDEITSFYFRPKDGRPLSPYRPGQYISLQRLVPELGIKQNRQYSLSDTPNPAHYRISVKREPGIQTHAPSGALDTTRSSHPGWMSNLLHATLHEGDTIELAHPFGDFFLDASPAPLVLLSAGVGATPLLAMLNTVADTDTDVPQRPVTWVHGARNGRAHAFKAHVARIAQAHPDRVSATVFYSEPDAGDALGKDYDVRGRVDLGQVEGDALRLEDRTAQYYVCGPERFMADMFAALRARGVDADRLHAEVFGAGANPE